MEYESLRNHLFEEIVRVGKIENKDEKQKQSDKLEEKIRKMNALASVQQEQMLRRKNENWLGKTL